MQDIKPIVKELQEAIRDGIDAEFFGTRKRLNSEKVEYLIRSKDFKNTIKKTRKDFNIPKLELSTDIREVSYSIGDDSVEDALSDWVESLPKYKKRNFKNTIQKILNDFNLPQNFYDWVEYYILYKKPEYMPWYNFDLPFQIIENPQELSRIPITIQEKYFIKAYVRRKLKIKSGRPHKAVRKLYDKILSALDKSKNVRRRARVLKESLRIPNNPRPYFDTDLNKFKKATLRQVVSTYYPKSESENAERKKLEVIKKRKQRLNKRQRIMLGK